MSGQRQRTQGETGEIDQTDHGEDDLGTRRAVLLENEAKELRLRLDALLDEIGRHRRLTAAERLRRYAIPAGIAVAAIGTVVFVLAQWRRRQRHTTVWRLTRVLPS
jgi:hypothetical protein